MKVVEVVDVLALGKVPSLPTWCKACADVQKAILSTDWPHGSGKFSLNPGTVKHANGVVEIKRTCMAGLRAAGWKLEQLPTDLAGVRMGNLDALLQTNDGPIGFEWETGNISSSHRAINKIFHAMLKGGLLGGILVVPSEGMRRYLTDRIGNITELREYFPVWQALNLRQGAFRIVVVEHDELSIKAPLLPKGTDGRALV
jgi:hypothetical protein